MEINGEILIGNVGWNLRIANANGLTSPNVNRNTSGKVIRKLIRVTERNPLKGSIVRFTGEIHCAH